MRLNSKPILAIALISGLPTVLCAQVTPSASYAVQADGAAYADIADLVTIAPLIVDATVKKVKNVPEEQAVGVPVTVQRVLIEADVTALIRGTGGVTNRVRFVLDLTKDAKGKIPKLNKQRFFILGSQVPNQPGNIRLASPNALIAWSAANDALVRSITKEAVEIDAPQKVTGILSGFYSAGTVLGEGETQVFLKTERNAPLSLSIVSRPGQAKRWVVSTSEVIDEFGKCAGAAQPAMVPAGLRPSARFACGQGRIRRRRKRRTRAGRL